MKNLIVLASAAGLLLLSATACSTTPTPGTPGPAPSAAPTSTSPSVPKVANPLDVAKYEQNPCALLSAAQATDLIKSVRNGQGKGLVAPICTWYDANGSSIGVGMVPGQGGLAGAYTNSDSQSGYFEAAPDVNGYPAVFAGTTDDRKRGGCQVAVGVKDDELFTTDVMLDKTSPDYSNPCPLAAKAAAAAITTIKAGA